MHTITELPKNILRNMRCRRLSARHPREWLYREIARLLMATPGNWADRSANALAIWDQYN